jgi:hypothetical protein
MTDLTINRYLCSGTKAQRIAFTPAPATPASGPSPACVWVETDTGYVYVSANGGAWVRASDALPTKPNCRAGTTGALAANTYANGTSGVGATLTGNSNAALAAQDGVTLVANDRLLVKNEVTGANNGIYELTQVGDGSHPYILTRTTDADAAAELVDAAAFISEGSTLADQLWICTTNAPITVGSTSLVFAQIGAGGGGTTTNALTGTNTGGAVPGTTFNGSSAKTFDYSTFGAARADSGPPGGRLTLVTATPVMNSDQTAKSTVYYTPYVTDQISIYDGTNWGAKTFTELSLALDTSNHLLENLYDVFVWNNSGTIAIGTGPAWVNTATVTWTSASPGVCSWTAHGLVEGSPVIFTAGTATPTGITAGTTYYVSKTGLTANAFSVSTSVANAAAGTNVNTSSTGTGTQTGTNHTSVRGTGAGTTELQMLSGTWTNKNSITLKNGAGGGTAGVAANTALYVGTIYCTANGQTGMAFKPAAASGGTNNILGVYNAYNRVPILATCRDSAADYAYSTATWRAADGNTANRISVIDGLQQSPILVTNNQVAYNNSGVAGIARVGTNLDSTSAIPDVVQSVGTTATSAGQWIFAATPAQHFPPQLGVHYLQKMEVTGSGTMNFAGLSSSLQSNSLVVALDM